jgi:hypothetical protein
MIFPGPLLPPIVQSTLTPEGIDLLLNAARSAGLTGPDRQLDFPGIADATTSVFIVVTPEGRHTTTVYALHEAAGIDGRLPADERATRAALTTFESQLFDLRSVLGADNVTEQQPYVPTRMRLFVHKAQDPIDPGQLPQTKAWPLSDLATFGESWPAGGADTRCGVVEGTDLAATMPLFKQATQLARWTSGTTAYQLKLRPMLPDESGCPAGFG